MLRSAIRACGALAIAFAVASAAATGPPAPAPAPAPATLELGGRKVVTFRAAVLGYAPAVRVEGARQRLLGAYEANPLLKLSVRNIGEGSQVIADNQTMFIVVPGDVNALAGETTEATATKAVEVLRTIIEERAERGDPGALARGAGIAVAVTLFWILLLRFIFAMDARVGRWSARRLGEHMQRVRVSGVSVLDESQLLRSARLSVRILAWILVAITSFLWLNAILESIAYTRPWGSRLTTILLETLATVGEAILGALPGLMFVVVIALMANLVVKAGRVFFDRVQERNLKVSWLDRDTAAPTQMVFTVLVWIFALAMAYPYIPGSESRAFQGLSVLVGLMVSIGASSSLGQAASGLILMYSRAFRVGEYVRIENTEGTVTEVGLFVTRVRTGLGEEVTLPNSMVLANTSKNYSRAHPGTGFVLDTVVTIGYDAPWRQVQAMLIEAALRTPAVVKDPAPRVFQTALSDFYAEYRLVAHSQVEDPRPRAEALDALHASIQDVFNEHGVQIMSPHYLADPAEPKVVPKSRWFEPPARKP